MNISSVAALAHMGVAAVGYDAPKAAIVHLTQTAAYPCAQQGIRINAISAELIETPMVLEPPAMQTAFLKGSRESLIQERHQRAQLGRMATPWEVADAAVFLCSHRAAYITGVNLVVDGGVSLGFQKYEG